MKLILSNNIEIEVLDGSTLFDIQIEPENYFNTWKQFTSENMKVIKLVNENGDLIDQKSELVVENEFSIKEKDIISCHFYLREKNREELLEEKIIYLETMLGVHDGAIGDLAVAVSDLSEQGGIN